MAFHTVTKLSPSSLVSLGDMWRYFNQQQSMGDTKNCRSGHSKTASLPPVVFLPFSKTQNNNNKKVAWPLSLYRVNMGASKFWKLFYLSSCHIPTDSEHSLEAEAQWNVRQKKKFMMWEMYTYFYFILTLSLSLVFWTLLLSAGENWNGMLLKTHNLERLPSFLERSREER